MPSGSGPQRRSGTLHVPVHIGQTAAFAQLAAYGTAAHLCHLTAVAAWPQNGPAKGGAGLILKSHRCRGGLSSLTIPLSWRCGVARVAGRALRVAFVFDCVNSIVLPRPAEAGSSVSLFDIRSAQLQHISDVRPGPPLMKRFLPQSFDHLSCRAHFANK